MKKRKPTIKYYFSVEGETEQWYLKWLENIVNSEEAADCRVSIKADVEKNPLKYVKRTSFVGNTVTTVWHLCDLTLDNVKQALERAEWIEERNVAAKNKLIQHKGFHFYRENPSLGINGAVGMILSDAGLL